MGAGGSAGRTPSRLLLLGPGGAGKSTLFRQIKLRYAKGFTEDELAKGASTIRMALLLSLRMLIRHEAIVDAMAAEGNAKSEAEAAVVAVVGCVNDSGSQVSSRRFSGLLEASARSVGSARDNTKSPVRVRM